MLQVRPLIVCVSVYICNREGIARRAQRDNAAASNLHRKVAVGQRRAGIHWQLNTPHGIGPSVWVVLVPSGRATEFVSCPPARLLLEVACRPSGQCWYAAPTLAPFRPASMAGSQCSDSCLSDPST